MKKERILVMNLGSTSSKIAVYDDDKEVFNDTLRHTTEELAPFGDVQLKGMSLAAVVGMLLGLVMYLLDKFKLTNEYEDADENVEETLKTFASTR